MRQVETNICVFFLCKNEASKSETINQVNVCVSFFSSRLVILPWTNRLCLILSREALFLASAEWCLVSVLVDRGFYGLLKARGLTGWTAESDHWLQNTASTTPVLLLWWHTERVLPGSLRPQTRVNKHNQLRKHLAMAGESPRMACYQRRVSKYRGACWSWCCNIVFTRSCFQVQIERSKNPETA